MKSKHVIKYLGQGIWKDNKGKLWSKDEKEQRDILSAREFESASDEETFLNSRPDIKFMVEYGQMSINTISLDTEGDKTPPAEKEDIKTKQAKTITITKSK